MTTPDLTLRQHLEDLRDGLTCIWADMNLPPCGDQILAQPVDEKQTLREIDELCTGCEMRAHAEAALEILTNHRDPQYPSFGALIADDLALMSETEVRSSGGLVDAYPLPRDDEKEPA